MTPADCSWTAPTCIDVGGTALSAKVVGFVPLVVADSETSPAAVSVMRVIRLIDVSPELFRGYHGAQQPAHAPPP